MNVNILELSGLASNVEVEWNNHIQRHRSSSEIFAVETRGRV